MEFNARAIHYIAYTVVIVLLLSWKHTWTLIIAFINPQRAT